MTETKRKNKKGKIELSNDIVERKERKMKAKRKERKKNKKK